MAMITFCNRKRLKFSESEADINFRQKWSEDDNVRVWFIVYRILTTMYFLASLIFTWTDEKHGWKYLIFMTSWGICLLNFSIILETVVVVLNYLDVSLNVRIFKVSWLCSTLFSTNAVFITILYWSLLYDGGPHPSYKDLYVHGLQGLFVVIDQFISNRQWHLEKIWTCLPTPVVYVIFNVIYWAAGGTDPYGNSYIYDVLDWSDDPGGAAITIVMAAGILPLIHIVLWLIALSRDWVHSKVFLTTTTTRQITVSEYNNNAFTETV